MDSSRTSDWDRALWEFAAACFIRGRVPIDLEKGAFVTWEVYRSLCKAGQLAEFTKTVWGFQGYFLNIFCRDVRLFCSILVDWNWRIMSIYYYIFITIYHTQLCGYKVMEVKFINIKSYRHLAIIKYGNS